MPGSLTARLHSAFRVGVALIPWLAAMYVFYWLDASGTWTSDTPHRGKLSVMILGSGMLVSFLLHSYLAGRGRRKSRN